MISEKMLLKIESLMPRIFDHSFNKQLFAGTLAKECFIEFLRQDKIYLQEFCKVLKKTAVRLLQTEHQQLFHRIAEAILKTEAQLYQMYLSTEHFQFFSLAKTSLSTKLNSSLEQYIRFLQQMADEAPIEISVASLIPCFHLYAELGQKMGLKISKTNPYYLWIETYSDPEFLQFREALFTIANVLASTIQPEKQDQMIETFFKSTEHEITFWDSLCAENALSLTLNASLSIK